MRKKKRGAVLAPIAYLICTSGAMAGGTLEKSFSGDAKGALGC